MILFQLLEVEQWLMKTPPITTIRVNLLRSSVDAVKDLVREAHSSKYGSDQKLSMIDHPNFPELLGIEPLQPPEMNNNLITGAVTVDSNCGRSILRGAHIFAPGVLSMSSKCSINDEVQVYVDLEGKCKKGAYEFESDNKLFVGIGRILQPRYKLFGKSLTPSGIAVEMDYTVVPHVPSIGDSYLTGSNGILQNFPSMVAVRALNPMAGDTILDMCSAPGHKTHHIVELMKDTGTVIALDKVKKKITEMERKIEELKYKSVKCFALDSSKCIKDSASGTLAEGPPFLPCSFDKVLLDAPCSGLGNRPQLPGSNKTTVKMLQSYPVLQKQLFFAAVAALKPGGTLVYSTCTINQSENEAVVEWALQKFPNLHLVPINQSFGASGWPTTGLSTSQSNMVKRFGPPSSSEQEISMHNSIGFFVAKFLKDA